VRWGRGEEIPARREADAVALGQPGGETQVVEEEGGGEVVVLRWPAGGPLPEGD